MEIEIRGSDQSPSLNARKTWEALFRLVQAERFWSLDSFLCDLRIFEDYFERNQSFWWEWDESGVTTVWEYDTQNEQSYSIQLIPGRSINIQKHKKELILDLKRLCLQDGRMIKLLGEKERVIAPLSTWGEEVESDRESLGSLRGGGMILNLETMRLANGTKVKILDEGILTRLRELGIKFLPLDRNPYIEVKDESATERDSD